MRLLILQMASLFEGQDNVAWYCALLLFKLATFPPIIGFNRVKEGVFVSSEDTSSGWGQVRFDDQRIERIRRFVNRNFTLCNSSRVVVTITLNLSYGVCILRVHTYISSLVTNFVSFRYLLGHMLRWVLLGLRT